MLIRFEFGILANGSGASFFFSLRPIAFISRSSSSSSDKNSTSSPVDFFTVGLAVGLVAGLAAGLTADLAAGLLFDLTSFFSIRKKTS